MHMSDETPNSTLTTGTALPKEPLTAFQRWEFASFDPVPESKVTSVQSAESAAAQLHEIRQRGYTEGYAAGRQAGYAAGMQQAQIETAKLQTLIQSFQDALTPVDEQLAHSLLDLSLEIAQKMVIEALRIHPEIILKIINTAIASLPHFNQNAHLIMNPGDADLVRKHMGENLTHAGWKIFSDPKIAPGGCRVETAHSNIDATTPARWQCIVESIGQDKSWLMT